MNNMTIFDYMYPKYKITKPIRLIELFSGYGSQSLALKYLGVNFEHWKTCEWAVKSIQAYKDIHFNDDDKDYSDMISKEDLVEILYKLGISSNYNEPMKKEQIKRLSEDKLKTIYNNIISTNNLVNIQQVKGKDLEIQNTDKYEYIMTYSFPCQDLSLAGKGKGMSDTSTRSGMLWEVERILSECEELPQILLMENVPQVHSEDNMKDFYKWQLRLEELGYKNYWQDLIATDYGIPQTRNRCFMISILGDYSYSFPKPIPLKLKLKDLLENDVSEQYYLTNAMLNYMYGNNKNNDFPRKEIFERNLQKTNEQGIASTITTLAGQRPTDNFIKDDNLKKELCNKLIENRMVEENDVIRHSYSNSRLNDWDKRNVEHNNLSPTLDTRCDCLGVVVKDTENYIEWEDGKNIQMNCRAWKDDKVVATLNTGGETKILENNGLVINPLKGVSGKSWQFEQQVYDENGSARTLKASEGSGNIPKVVNDLRIRKLTPKECFRLMGVKDEDYEKCAKNQSNASLYHLAGDSIVVNVLMAIFKEILKGEK